MGKGEEERAKRGNGKSTQKVMKGSEGWGMNRNPMSEGRCVG
jgi:hypothetical protein